MNLNVSNNYQRFQTTFTLRLITMTERTPMEGKAAIRSGEKIEKVSDIKLVD